MQVESKSIGISDLDSAVKGGPWLLTGEPGAGKDYVVKTYLASKDFQSLDEASVKEGKKWMVDVAKICHDPSHLRVYGMCDNLKSVANTLKDCYEKKTLKLIIVQPSYELFKSVNAVKAGELKDENPEAAEECMTRSRLSLAAYNRLMANRNANFIRWTEPTEVYVCINELREGARVENGRHKEATLDKVEGTTIKLEDKSN